MKLEDMDTARELQIEWERAKSLYGAASYKYTPLKCEITSGGHVYHVLNVIPEIAIRDAILLATLSQIRIIEQRLVKMGVEFEVYQPRKEPQ